MTLQSALFLSISCLILFSSACNGQLAAQQGNLRGNNQQDAPPKDQTKRNLVDLKYIAKDVRKFSLKRCEGDCDGHENCSGNLVCFKRDGNDPIPGCGGELNANPGADYCIRKQDHPDFKLGHCKGDCDNDDDCAGNLVCFERERSQFMSQCPNSINDNSLTDYCIEPDNNSDSNNEESSNRKVDIGDTDPASETDQGPDIPPIEAIVNQNTKPTSNPPRVVSSSTKWQKNGIFELAKPIDMKLGDLMVLVVSRSDDYNPIARNGWNTVASCFKEDNADKYCALHTECTQRDGDYCLRFQGNRKGWDLASTVFTKPVEQNDLDSWSLKVDLKTRSESGSGRPGWSILAIVRDADLVNPVRGFASTSCDTVRQSIFPSVPGAKKDDLLLLHMAYDDAADEVLFQPPQGMQWAGYVKGTDETGVMYQQTLAQDGDTGPRTTLGDGWRGLCKDANISLVIRK